MCSTSLSIVAAEILRFIRVWYENQEVGQVMAVTRETSKFSDGPMVDYVADFRRIRSRRSARAHFRTKHRLWSIELPTTQHRMNFVHQPTKVTRIISIVTSRGGKDPASCRCRPFQSLPLWFCLIIRWRRESHLFADEALKDTGAKTQSDVQGQENPSQASGDRLHFPGVA